jgi:Tubulin binding cofactor C
VKCTINSCICAVLAVNLSDQSSYFATLHQRVGLFKYRYTTLLSACTDSAVNCLCTCVFEQICHVLDALRLRGLSHCTVYCGPVRGSVYVEDCSDCTVVVACRQLRIHTTYRTDMYVHTLSGPIIEDCNAIR